MPLVFVHGVNVRRGKVYEREQAFRDRHFAEIFYRQLGRNVEASSILNPYWGDLGASVSPDVPFLPHGNYQMLWKKQGKNTPEAATPKLEDIIEAESETPLLDLARTASLADVIDLLWLLADQEMIASGNENRQSEEEMARLAQKALDFSHSPEGERWLATVKSDDELIERLSGLLSSPTSQNPKPAVKAKTQIGKLIKSAGASLHGKIKDAHKGMASRTKSLKARIDEDVLNARLRLRQKAVGTTAKIFNEPLRAIFHQQCALLIGDAFAYFSDRGDDSKAAPMAQRVIETLREARAIQQKTGDELIVIGHSMGGVILCDIVTCYGKDIPIDVLITVGSQFPLFADLQMFPGITGKKHPIQKPENVERWINIFDPHDFLGYPASHIFEGVEDFHIPTYSLGGSAHANYFNRRSFYFQLARRLMDYVDKPKPGA